jgi:hypothetical protein
LSAKKEGIQLNFREKKTRFSMDFTFFGLKFATKIKKYIKCTYSDWDNKELQTVAEFNCLKSFIDFL